jgi:hypothetical protein
MFSVTQVTAFFIITYVIWHISNKNTRFITIFTAPLPLYVMVKVNGPVNFRLIAYPDYPAPHVTVHTVFAWKHRRNHENHETG